MTHMLSYPRPWLDAWAECASGSAGFWSRNLPGEHFRTAAATGDGRARMVLGLLTQQPEIRAVVEVGAGGGELLTRLAGLRPDLSLAGIDLRSRPTGLAPRVGWARDRWDVLTGRWSDGPAAERLAAIRSPTLVVADEFLDDLPCRVAHQGSGGWREVLVDQVGRETLGPALAAADLGWVERWWAAGPRAEIGLTREGAWTGLLEAVRPYGGSALLIDYGHLTGTRPTGGTLTGYRAGRQVRPVPTPDRNLTAHVAVDALRDAGERAGARTRWCRTQQSLVDELWPGDGKPGPDVVADLVERSHRQALAAPSGWGAQWWLWQS